MSWKLGDMKFIKKEFQLEVEEYMSLFTVTVHKGIIYAIVEPTSDTVFANFEDEIISFKKLIFYSPSSGILFYFLDTTN